MPAGLSRGGTVHNLAAIPVFFGLPAATAVYGWRSWRAGQAPGFAVCCAATSQQAQDLSEGSYGRQNRQAITATGLAAGIAASSLSQIPDRPTEAT